MPLELNQIGVYILCNTYVKNTVIANYKIPYTIPAIWFSTYALVWIALGFVSYIASCRRPISNWAQECRIRTELNYWVSGGLERMYVNFDT